MAVKLVEVHQVGEDETSLQLAKRLERLRHAVCVVFGLLVILNAAAQEDVEYLAHAKYSNMFSVELIEEHAFWRRNRVVATIGRTRERAGLSNERARDHAADLVRPA